MKSILLSVRPEHALNILNGTKTLELRKLIPHDFVGLVYVYVTKVKRYGDIFVRWSDEILRNYKGTPKYQILGYEAIGGDNTLLNGRVVARFWFDEYIKLEWLDPSLNIQRNDVNYYNYYALFENIYNNVEWILPNLCLTKQQVIDYGKERDLYAWHITKLEIFTKPKELREFAHWNFNLFNSDGTHWFPVKRAPQKMMYVKPLGE